MQNCTEMKELLLSDGKRTYILKVSLEDCDRPQKDLQFANGLLFHTQVVSNSSSVATSSMNNNEFVDVGTSCKDAVDHHYESINSSNEIQNTANIKRKALGSMTRSCA
ncbi:hypothetical protein ILUMI_11525 [Ignelater luminosus]|uniref:Uncharacterized protein n=1 Tax=Ignelater luminosus TaxID=2038154 RepID=A0A8K0CY94_IGNLU|nr:hypothetical protein ILUMI_11525 [Ignelater luminosus]